jgi:hypothetical protein
MGRPDERQLAMINRMAVEPVTADDVYVFRPLMIDDQETSYTSVIHPNLLRKFLKDSARGVALLPGHDSSKLPIGRTFNAEMVQEFDQSSGDLCNSLYGEVYIDLGRNTEGGMTTNDIAKGISSGTIFDVSIGFNAKSFCCSICGNDIRDYANCPHIPGREYSVDEDEEGSTCKVKRCQVIVGEDGIGELLELSLVYAGACGRATIKNNFSINNVTNDIEGTKLAIVDDIKRIPLNSTVYQQLSRDGHYMYAVLENNVDINENKRSESDVKYFEIINSKLGLEIENDEQLESKLEEYLASKTSELSEKTSELETVKTELSNKEVELESKSAEITELTASKEALTTELEEVKLSITAKDETIVELTVKNEELTEKAGLAETYRQELITSTIESGVRAQGNAFQAELFEKFLATLSIEEIKSAREGFEKEFNARVDGTRLSDGTSFRNRTTEPTSKEDFDTDKEYKDYIAEKAISYAKENGVSIKEATQQLINQFSIKRSE